MIREGSWCFIVRVFAEHNCVFVVRVLICVHMRQGHVRLYPGAPSVTHTSVKSEIYLLSQFLSQLESCLFTCSSI